MPTMILPLLAGLWALAAYARADCDACVDGWCHTRKTYLQGFNVTDQLAIDHTHNVLYLQLNSNLNSAFYLDDLKVRLFQLLNTSGMTVDQKTHDLYVADYNRNIYKFKYGSDTPELFSVNPYEPDVDLLFYKDNDNYIYYTSRHNKELKKIDHEKKYFWIWGTKGITITDLVESNRSTYYAADKKVFAFNATSETNISRKLITDQNCVLSMDIHKNVYIGDAKVKTIYKVNESDEPVEYAAYKTGSVDKFVFDRDNNIVFHDAADGSIATWKKGLTQCKIIPQKQCSLELNTIDEYSIEFERDDDEAQ